MNEHIAAMRDEHILEAVWIRLHKESAMVDLIMNGDIGLADKELREEAAALEEELAGLIL